MSATPNDPAGRNRWAIMYEAVTGATASDHHEEKPGTSSDSQKAGHEADRFDARGIIMVPFGVIATCATVYVLITVLFNVFEPGATVPSDASAQAKAESAKPYNERIAKISSSDEKSQYAAPRLEYMKNIDNSRDGAKDPIYVRSFLPVQGGANTYELTPQDLYPQNFADPRTGKKSLAEYAWINKEKGVAQIPVAVAMKMLVGNLPAEKASGGSTNGDKAKLSNGGQAVNDAPTVAAPTAPKHEDKH
jgi:hypothetical protein